MIVLVLAPHTDDGELGCGGTIAKFVKLGHVVHYVAFSAAEKSVPVNFPSDVLRQEVVAATGVLGLPRDNLRILDFEVRNFPSCRQEILESMVKLQRELNPSMVLLPSTFDTHQDHRIVSDEGFRVFKKTTLIGYEVPNNNLTFETNLFIGLAEADLEAKLAALQCYHSQIQRHVFQPDFIRCLARVRGGQINVTYAEAFEVIRWVM